MKSTAASETAAPSGNLALIHQEALTSIVRLRSGRQSVTDAQYFRTQFRKLRAFLGRAYNLKALADYETSPGSQVSAESAREAIQTAHRFVACIAGLIPANGHALAPHTPQP